MKPLDRLAIAAEELRRVSPSQYADFGAALDACLEQAKDNLVAAPGDALLRTQGQAAAWQTVTRIVRDAHQLAAALQVKK